MITIKIKITDKTTLESHEYALYNRLVGHCIVEALNRYAETGNLVTGHDYNIETKEVVL